MSLIYACPATPGEWQPAHLWRCRAKEMTPDAHGVRPALELWVVFQTITSASKKDKSSTPIFSPLCFRSSSKGFMRMISFRPGVRLFSTFSSRTDAFWGVSQITMAISAESRNRARGHLPALPWTWCLGRRKEFLKISKPVGPLKDINYVCKSDGNA